MTSDALSALEAEVARLRAWAEALPENERRGEWEFHYDDWGELYSAFAAFVATTSCHDWSDDTTQMLLYAIARDNEMEELAEMLVEYPEKLVFLAERALASEERNATWQLANELGKLELSQAEPVLLCYWHHKEEYVRRRALIALGRLGSSHVEELAAEAWDSGEEYQRIGALCALEYVGSPLLREYAARDEAVSTPALAKYAEHIRETGTLSDFRIQGIPVIY